MGDKIANKKKKAKAAAHPAPKAPVAVAPLAAVKGTTTPRK